MLENGGPVQQVLAEQNIVLAGFGALGGMVRSAALKTTWKEGIRVTFIGSATSFGFGVLSPSLVEKFVGVDIPAGMANSMGVVCACAFMVGLIAITLIERFVMSGNPTTAQTDSAPPQS